MASGLLIIDLYRRFPSRCHFRRRPLDPMSTREQEVCGGASRDSPHHRVPPARPVGRAAKGLVEEETAALGIPPSATTAAATADVSATVPATTTTTAVGSSPRQQLH